MFLRLFYRKRFVMWPALALVLVVGLVVVPVQALSGTS